MTKILRVRATGHETNACFGCLGCGARPDRSDGQMDCISSTPNGGLLDFIYILDTPKARAAYAALILEHGLQPERRP